jgi:hypothetical protein
MVRKGWSYKEDRRLSELAGSGKTLEQIAKAMDRTPDFVRNRSLRLGISIKSKAATRKIRGPHFHGNEAADFSGLRAQDRKRPMTVLIYVDTSKQVGDSAHLKVFANADAAETWFEENDPEGVAFEYEVLE